MRKYVIFLLCAVFSPVILSLPAPAQSISCAECGMTSDLASKYTARIVKAEKILYFCDIGDLLVFINKKKEQNIKAEVKDFITGEWLEAQKAYYVHDEKKFKTPMAWGVASFKTKKEAAAFGPVMSFPGALETVR